MKVGNESDYHKLSGSTSTPNETKGLGQRLCGDKQSDQCVAINEQLLAEQEQPEDSVCDGDNDDDHHHGKETGSERFWKLVTLLAGLYTAELLRFV